MISEMKEIEIGDIAILCNYLNDEASANGILTDPRSISANFEGIARDKFSKIFKIEDDGVIIAFMAYEEFYHENILAHFYIVPKYRVYRSVIIPMVRELVNKFKGKRLYYKKLHAKVDAITHYANNGEIDLVGLEEYLNNIKR